jgi:hypothetical protein
MYFIGGVYDVECFWRKYGFYKTHYENTHPICKGAPEVLEVEIMDWWVVKS